MGARWPGEGSPLAGNLLAGGPGQLCEGGGEVLGGLVGDQVQGGGWAEASTDGTRRGEQDRKYRKMLAKKHKNVKMKERNIRTSYPICWAVMQAAKEVKKLRDVGFQHKAMLWVRIREMQRFFCKPDAIVER